MIYARAGYKHKTTLKFYAYIFDKDGAIFTEPVSWWVFVYAPSNWKNTTISDKMQEALECLATGGKRPEDLRDTRMRVTYPGYLPRGDVPLYAN
jgi:hypothetical protein